MSRSGNASGSQPSRPKERFLPVSHGEPCPICRSTGWCLISPDGEVAYCMRVESPRPHVDSVGLTGWTHFLSDPIPMPVPGAGLKPASTIPRADPRVVADVYSALLTLLPLTPTHRRALLARGLDDDAIERARYRTWPGQGRAAILKRLCEDFDEKTLLGIPGIWHDGERLRLSGLSGLAIPARDADGSVLAISLRPDEPKGGKYVWLSSRRRGDAAKGVKPYDGPPTLMFAHVPPAPPGGWADRSVGRSTEGALKAHVAAHLSGVLTIGLPGLAWANAADVLLGMGVRKVLLAFDADKHRNKHVMHAERAAAEGLHAKGFEVATEEWDMAAGKGIDDLLHRGGRPETRPFVPADVGPPAAPPEPPRATDDLPPDDAIARVRVNEAPDDPHRLARLFLDGRIQGRHRTFIYWRDEWLRWRCGAYGSVPAADMRGQFENHIKREFDRLNRIAILSWEANGQKNNKGQKVPRPVCRPVKGPLVNNVDGAMRGMALVDADVDAPAWLTAADSDPPADRLVVCRNGAIDLSQWAEGRLRLMPPTPRLFTHNALDFDFDPHAPTPELWLEFLEKLWGQDAEAIGLLQEWIGYTLTADTSQQKILLVVGPRRGGKGTIAWVKGRLVGKRNCAGPTLSSLGGPFGLQSLLGKSLAIISDARLGVRTDTNVVTERLLSISGEDALDIDRKNLRALHQRLLTRFAIFTNELPRLKDASAALVGRFLLLRLTKSWMGKEDRTLKRRLAPELPGILLWAMEGWKRLNARGHFVQPASSCQMLGQMEAIASPIGAFIRDRCTVGEGRSVLVDDLYSEYSRWCEEQGRDAPDKGVFGRDMFAAVPGLARTQPRVGNKRPPTYQGVCIASTEPPSEGGAEGAGGEEAPTPWE